MSDRIEEFQSFRKRMNEELLEQGSLELRRFFALDDRVYEDDALPRRTKELLGLVASLVLRCDDCVTYHLLACHETGWTRDELLEAMTVGLVVGGSITIPHLRRALARLDEIEGDPPSDQPTKENPVR